MEPGSIPVTPRLLSVKQAGAALNTSPRSIWRLLSLGELAKVRVGRAVRIPIASVEDFIAKGGAA